jgi:hypothetical protein
MPSNIEKLVEKLFDRLARPVIPVAIDLWDTTHIGAYLKRSTDNVRKEIVCLPSFPVPVRLPVHGKAQALYLAREVIQWAESFRSKSRN